MVKDNDKDLSIYTSKNVYYHPRVSYLTESKNISSIKRGSRQDSIVQNKWYIDLDRLVDVKDYDRLSKEKGDKLHIVQKDRIESSFELEDSIARVYGKYILIKYDIISIEKSVIDYMDFFLFLTRFRNNIRMKKDIHDLVIGENYCIDLSKNNELHMHLFLYLNCNWLSGSYSKDKEVYKEKIRDLNKWMVKLIRTDKRISNTLINIPDERESMMDSLTDVNDYFSRNDNRDYLIYLSKVDIDYVNQLNHDNTCRIRLFGRSNLPSEGL